MGQAEIRAFFDQLDALEWGELHYWWLDKPAVALRDWLYTRILDRAQILLQAAQLPGSMAEAILPAEEEPEPVGSWAHMFAMLRRAGYDLEKLTLEETLLLLAYELDKTLAAPYNSSAGARNTAVGQ